MSTNNNPFLAAISQMAALNTKPESIRITGSPTTGRTSTITNPEGLTLRVFKDGRVLPGQELVDTFNLEYQNQVVGVDAATPEEATTILQAHVGNGIDIFMAYDLSSFPKELPNGLLVTFTPKSEAKVNLFKTTEYSEDGTPKSSVMSQFKVAASSFGKNSLIPMLEVVLNKGKEEIFKESKFIDLEVLPEAQLPIAGDHLWIPKKKSRGQDAGQLQLSKRDKQPVMVLSILAQEETLTEQDNSVEDTVESPVEQLEQAN